MLLFLCTHQFVVLQLFGVDAFGVPDASVQFSDSDAPRSKAVKVAHAVKPHVTEALQAEQRAH